MSPCRHACALFRKLKEVDVNYVFANLVNEIYTFGNCHENLYENCLSRQFGLHSILWCYTPPLVSYKTAVRLAKNQKN